MCWNDWRKKNQSSRLHKLGVLFGFIHSPTFAFHYAGYVINYAFWKGLSSGGKNGRKK